MKIIPNTFTHIFSDQQIAYLLKKDLYLSLKDLVEDISDVCQDNTKAALSTPIRVSTNY